MRYWIIGITNVELPLTAACSASSAGEFYLQTKSKREFHTADFKVC